MFLDNKASKFGFIQRKFGHIHATGFLPGLSGTVNVRNTLSCFRRILFYCIRTIPEFWKNDRITLACVGDF